MRGLRGEAVDRRRALMIGCDPSLASGCKRPTGTRTGPPWRGRCSAGIEQRGGSASHPAAAKPMVDWLRSGTRRGDDLQHQRVMLPAA